jgi:hypothetical protein
MVMCHEVGDGSHNRDEESDERRAVETPPDLAETVRSLRAELQSCKADNERLIKEQEKQTEINAVLLQSLSDIQRQLQHEPATSHVDRRHKKRSQSPPEIRKHDSISDHTRRSTSKKAQPGGRGHSSGESSGKEAGNSEGSSSSKLAHILKGKERSESIPKIMILKSSRNPNHPLSMERLRREKRLKLGLVAWFKRLRNSMNSGWGNSP